MEWLYPGILIPVWLPKLWCHTLKTFLIGKLLVWKYNQTLRKIFGKRSKCFVIPTICHLLSFFLTFWQRKMVSYLLEVEESRLLGFPSSIPLSWLVGLEVLEVRSKSSSIMEEVLTGGELSSIITLLVGGVGACLFFRDIFFFVSLFNNFFSSLCNTESWSPWFSWSKKKVNGFRAEKP